MRRIHSYSCMIWPTSYVLRTILHILWMCAAYMKAFYLHLLYHGPHCALLHNAGLWEAYMDIPTLTGQLAIYSEQYSSFCGCAQCKIPMFYHYLLSPGPLCALLHNAGLWEAYIAILTCTCQPAIYSEQYSLFCGCVQCIYPMFYLHLLYHPPLCAHLHKGEYERHTILSFHTPDNQLFTQRNIVHSMYAHIMNTYNLPSFISWFNLCTNAQDRIMRVHVPVITLTDH